MAPDDRAPDDRAPDDRAPDDRAPDDRAGFPPLLPPDQMPPIVDQRSLERTWRALMGPLGFAGPQLWVMILAEGRPLGLTKVEAAPLRPEPGEVAGLLDLLRDVVAADEELAFLFARPGRTRSGDDVAWARLLAGSPGGWPVHVANDRELWVITPDDLTGWADVG
ncbi:hypothetical protein E8D34_12455 [Nocardioides sp. GY 10113]|uniref:hypothetical protein n=1 Tax=Nocardioides sp. GY 10113 TaxID=2569761 RepID=UPI0010A92D64|nr:hypothetical protein [Nocardioides sp. GY 10113]TIC85906.1 hypothetical protein E8D34_12455 [Nocardioides sp. GY 10113]